VDLQGDRVGEPDEQQTETRLGKQRGAKIAQVYLARRLAEAIWTDRGGDKEMSAARPHHARPP
jgi:hypothetical protein